MGQLFLIVVVALTVAAVVFGVTVLVSGSDGGLAPVEPDGRAVPLPASRPLQEGDLGDVRFDTAARGYRMVQVDQALRRAAYDIGYKDELIGVLEAEVTALREGRTLDADALRRAREAAQQPTAVATLPEPADPDGPAPAPAVVGVEPPSVDPTAQPAVAPPAPATVPPASADGAPEPPAGSEEGQPVAAEPPSAASPAEDVSGETGSRTTS